jgi:hypothetical protein
MALQEPLPAAPPYVAYAVMSETVVPEASWPYVYGSLQAYKAHVQEYPGCQQLRVYVRPDEDGIRVHCYAVWDTIEQLEAFQERGYTFERLLADTEGLEVARTLVMEQVF